MSTPPVAAAMPVNAFVDLWVAATSTVLGQIASASYPMKAVPGEGLPAATADDVQLTITAGGSIRGEMSLRVPVSSAFQLIKIFTGAESPGPAPTSDDRAALEELFRQIAGHVITAARPKGLEAQLTTVVGEPPTWSPGASGWIISAPDAPQVIQIEWKLSSALATALANAWQGPDTAKPSSVEATEAKAGNAVPVNPAAAGGLPSKLDLLMELDLEVALRFGGRNILLKEILELGPGSVLELDRDIQDDADLLLDGKLIARGEVVSVEGNFGLRVTELFSRENGR